MSLCLCHAAFKQLLHLVVHQCVRFICCIQSFLQLCVIRIFLQHILERGNIFLHCIHIPDRTDQIVHISAERRCKKLTCQCIDTDTLVKAHIIGNILLAVIICCTGQVARIIINASRSTGKIMLRS